METDSGMDRLASCYFCGVAVEAPLEEYPVVPRDLRPSVEDQSTVVLCPECRRKLSTIVDRVVTVATDPDQSELTEDANQRTLGESDGSSEIDSKGEDASVLDGFDHDSPDLLDVNESESRDDVEEQSEKHTSATDERPERERAEEERDSAVDEREDLADSERETAGSSVGKRENTDALFGEREQPSRPESPTEGERDAEADEQSTVESGAHSSSGRDAPESSGTEQRNVSRSAYNRVVKLLQNRTFPVETAAIVTVADSAYDIDDGESQAILDALVDRGVIERDGDNLRRPETARDD